MSFISYAQNFEDVMLWRALKHVEAGFYIDIGANDPDADSVTKAFYDRGWRGINIEPVPQWFQRLQETRVRDINLQLAVGRGPGEITLYEIPDTGLSTAEKAFADRHEAERGYQNRELKVTQDTLANVCNQYHIAPIHFLKIDVEGMEKAVLEGADFGKIRPWIVLVESTLPNSREESHSEWEPTLLNAGYQHAYSDGINRFYVAEEHSELSSRFQYPPNVFDDFALNKHLETEARARDAETYRQEAESELAKVGASLATYQDELKHSASQVDQLKEALQASDNRAKEAEWQATASETEERKTKLRLEEAESELSKIRTDLARCQNELEHSEIKIGQLEHKLNEKNEELESKLSELQQEHDQSQWLHNEWDAARAKNEELNHSSHHWWAVADGFNQELQSIYDSRFWRLTWPLRKAMQALKAMFQFLAGFVVLPRKAASWILSKSITYVLRRDRLKHQVRKYIYRYPRLTAHLRAFAHKRHLQLESQISKSHEPNHNHAEVTERSFIQNKDKGYSKKRVAVVAPVAANGTVGGAERFYSGLTRALRSQGCEVSLLTLEVDESTFESIKQGYERFSNLNLDDYDLVISTKSPSYVVNHRNHVSYLVHTVRAFYDMFDTVFPQKNDLLLEQKKWIVSVDTDAFLRVRHQFSIGSEVSHRLLEYNGLDSEVLHPPIDLEGLYDGGIGDYLFMPGRLHEWKRVDLAIEAIKRSNLPIRLLIAGDGEAKAKLHKIADGDSRIEFLGRVDDESLRQLYSNALAIPFLPIREDYGYVTLEAFACNKPVITCSDSGEPNSFVQNNITGFVCDPNPDSLCDAFEKVWNDRQLAARMGRAGYERVKSITWSSVASRLLEVGFPEVKSTDMASLSSKLKVVVLDMQPITPAVGGGRQRLLGLYHDLGPNLEVRYIGTYDWPGEPYRNHFITPTLQEINVPLSSEHHRAAAESALQAGGKTVIDMIFSRQAHLSPEYLEETKKGVDWADVVIFSHPWITPLIDKQSLLNKLVIYDSHNVEADLRAQILDTSIPFESSILDDVISAERLTGDYADLVLCCSDEDIQGFASRYGWSHEKLKLVPNGVFSQKIKPAPPNKKVSIRSLNKIPEENFVCFFLGSDYAPNVEAARFIVEILAIKVPEALFVIGGGVCSKLADNLPINVRALGFMEEEEKQCWLQASDCGINPMFSGSGTNIKMFDFMSAELPVVTTHTGARGIAQQSTEGIIISEPEFFADAINDLMVNRAATRRMGRQNRHIVERSFAWENISPKLGSIINSLYWRNRGKKILETPEKASKLRIAHLSTMGLKCGIGEYSLKLARAYEQFGTANKFFVPRTPKTEPDLSKVKISAKIGWFFDDIEWSGSYIENTFVKDLVDWGASNLIVHYHPGFFSPHCLRELVKKVKEVGVFVVVINHNFDDRSAQVIGELNDLHVRVFSHRFTEINQAREKGVFLNWSPLGVDVNVEFNRKNIFERDWSVCPPTIITTGFLRKHKGAKLLIRAMPRVLEQFPKAVLRVQCALYPSPDSKAEFEACQKEIGNLDLWENCILDARFLDKDQVYSYLTDADISVLPYENSDEGASASANDCLAAGLPLLVSNAEIFNDLQDVAMSIEATPEGIAESIIEVLSNKQIYSSLASRSHSYAMEHSFKRICGAFV